METQQTKVSGKLAEELIKSTAGEKETTEPAVAKESSLNIMQEFLVGFFKEFREESSASYKQIEELKYNVLKNEDEIKDLRYCTLELKYCIESITLKGKESDNYSEIGIVTEVMSSSTKPDYSDDTENVINAQDRGTQEDLLADQIVQGKRSSLHDVEISSVSKAFNLRTMIQEKENVIEELRKNGSIQKGKSYH
jgi:hypothetical protein